MSLTVAALIVMSVMAKWMMLMRSAAMGMVATGTGTVVKGTAVPETAATGDDNSCEGVTKVAKRLPQKGDAVRALHQQEDTDTSA